MAERIKLNSSGIRALLSSDEMKSAIGRYAMGEGKIVKQFICGDRVDFFVNRGSSNADRGNNNKPS